MPATVTYVEKLGDEFPRGSGMRPIHFLAKRVELDASAATQPAAPQRFVDLQNGTLVDIEKKLMWQKRDDGMERTWDEGREYCKSLGLAGFKGWRLPKPDEPDEALVTEVMAPKRSKGRADWYWSKEPGVMVPFNYPTTHVLLSNLYGAKKESRAYVRAVREVGIGRVRGIIKDAHMKMLTGDAFRDVIKWVYITLEEKPQTRYRLSLKMAKESEIAIGAGDEDSSLVYVPGHCKGWKVEMSFVANATEKEVFPVLSLRRLTVESGRAEQPNVILGEITSIDSK